MLSNMRKRSKMLSQGETPLLRLRMIIIMIMIM